ncbi:MAG: type II toxin-antitoxin system VapC family toxin [Candidatus Korarchaeota archaeon]|nr:type II toxin-antitoxin system VapC family toxin [Candidatus Korarchaeota archaeon]
MAVVDTSVFVDFYCADDASRRGAEDLFRLIEEREVSLFEPRLLLIELLCVLSRKSGRAVEIVREIEDRVNVVGEDEIFSLAYSLAPAIKGRAADLYFTATAKLTGAILISNDRRQVDGARKAGVEAYYLLEEGERALERLGGGISAEETNRADREMKRDLRGTIEDRAPSERGTRRRRGRRHLHKGQLR